MCDNKGGSCHPIINRRHQRPCPRRCEPSCPRSSSNRCCSCSCSSVMFVKARLPQGPMTTPLALSSCSSLFELIPMASTSKNSKFILTRFSISTLQCIWCPLCLDNGYNDPITFTIKEKNRKNFWECLSCWNQSISACGMNISRRTIGGQQCPTFYICSLLLPTWSCFLSWWVMENSLHCSTLIESI